MMGIGKHVYAEYCRDKTRHSLENNDKPVIDGAHNPADEAEHHERLEKAMAPLKSEAQAIHQYHGLGYTMKEIAKAVGCSKSKVEKCIADFQHQHVRKP